MIIAPVHPYTQNKKVTQTLIFEEHFYIWGIFKRVILE